VRADRFHLSLASTRAEVRQQVDWLAVDAAAAAAAETADPGAITSEMTYVDDDEVIFDADFESLAHYSRMTGAAAPKTSFSEGDDAFNPDEVSESRDPLSSEAIVAALFRSLLAEPVTHDAAQAVLRNLEYYHSPEALQQQLQKQVQVVRAKRDEIRKRVKLSGARLDAFERDLIENMRRKTASQHHVQTLVVAAALCARYIARCLHFNQSVTLTQRSSECGVMEAATKAAPKSGPSPSPAPAAIIAAVEDAMAAPLACVVRGVVESSLFLPEMPKDAALAADLRGMLVRMRADKGAIDDARAPAPMSSSLQSQYQPQPQLQSQSQSQPQSQSQSQPQSQSQSLQSWTTFRPRMVFGIGAQAPSSLQQVVVLQKVAQVVEAATPKLTAQAPRLQQKLKRKPGDQGHDQGGKVGLATCCMQPLTDAFNVHDTLGVATTRAPTSAAKVDARRTRTRPVATLALTTVPRYETLKTQEDSLIEHDADLVVQVRKPSKSAGESETKAPPAKRTVTSVTLELLRQRPRWESDEGLRALAAATTVEAASKALSKIAGGLEGSFRDLLATLKLGSGEAAPPELRGAEEAFVSLRPFLQGVDVDELERVKEKQSLSAALSIFAGSTLRTLLGRVAGFRTAMMARRKPNQDGDERGKDQKGKSSGAEPTSFGRLAAKNVAECVALLAQSENAQGFVHELAKLTAECLPPQRLFVVSAADLGGKGLYTSALVAARITFATLRDAIELGLQARVPQRALQSLFLAALASLHETHTFNRMDTESELRSQNLQQLEDSKRKKIEVYERLSEEDKNFMREMRKIKAIDWDELEADVARKGPAAKEEDQKPTTDIFEAPAEEENYFMTSTAPGEDEDGHSEHEYDYED